VTLYNAKVKTLVGDKNITVEVFKNYDDLIIDFLSDISKQIFNNKRSKNFPDLISFAFWIRKSNLILNKNKRSNSNALGLGLVFHIPPSNIPLNFAYSFVFGLIGGNSNIVRVPNKKNEQTEILINILKKTLKRKKYNKIFKTNLLIKYDHDFEINKFYSENSDCRLIWGGDETINEFKKYTTKPTNIDILFPDKYSLSIINSEKLRNISKNEIKKLVKNFFNDTYLFDQNACTAPHLIIWTGNSIKFAKKIFWNNLIIFLKTNYKYNNFISVKKYSTLLKHFTKLNNIEYHKKDSNVLYRIGIKKLSINIDKFKGFAGIFFEYSTNETNDLKKIVNRRFQTLLYYGYEKEILKKIVLKNNFKGIDRIVPIGKGLDMNFLWDGYNLDNILSREIEIK
tara:strand:+ start:416 stop:1606 length:1191 start_codon:yes stop_codon:yes gene_type:complete